MTRRELTTEVTRQTLLAVLVAAVAGGWLGGASGALGVLTGGALGLIGFRWLAVRVRAMATATAPWAMVASVRFGAVSGAAALLFIGGWAHPVAWLVGYSALPLALVLQGLRLAREENGA
jgi:hypothetical protein